MHADRSTLLTPLGRGVPTESHSTPGTHAVRLGWAPHATAYVQATACSAAAPDRFHAAARRTYAGLDDARASAYTKPWFFIVLADTQFGMLNGGDDDVAEEELAMARLAVEHVNRLKPAFVIVCGDLINEFPSPELTSAARAARQTAHFKRTMDAIDATIPLVCCCGNHDVGNLPNRASIDLYRSRFGDDYFEYFINGSRCLVLNSSLLSAKEASREGDKKEALSLAAKQDTWIDERLRAQRDALVDSSMYWEPPLFIFTHIPPFLFARDEPKEYFNLEPSIRDPLLSKIDASVSSDRGARHPGPACSAKWFAGHYHRNAGGWWSDRVEVITSSAIGTTFAWKDEARGKGLAGFDWRDRRCDAASSGLRIVCISERYGGARHKWFTVDSVPLSIIADSDAVGGWEGDAPLVARI